MLAVDRSVAVHHAQSPCQSPAPCGLSYFNDAGKGTSTSATVLGFDPDEDIDSSWDLVEPPTSPEPNRSRSITPQEEPDYDVEAFPEHAQLFDREVNGAWYTSSLRAIKGPSKESFHSLRIHAEELQNKLEALADSACDEIKHRIDHSMDGHDLTELHGTILGRIPTISLPDVRHINQAVDTACDAAQTLLHNHKGADFASEITDGDRWAFAWTMGRKAREALIKQNICRKWQIMTTRKNIAWQDALNQQLAAAFNMMIEQEKFTSEELFKMEPNWRPTTDGSSWRLRLNTGYVAISKGRDDQHSFMKHIYLNVDFKLPVDFKAM